jgi:hypothetical protein
MSRSSYLMPKEKPVRTASSRPGHHDDPVTVTDEDDDAETLPGGESSSDPEKLPADTPETLPAVPPDDSGVTPLATGAAGLAVNRPSRFSEVHIVARGAGGGGHAPTIGTGAVVPLRIIVPATQSVNTLEIVTAAGVVLFSISATGVPSA